MLMNLWLWFAYGFDDAAAGGDGLENGLEDFFGLGLVALKLDVAMFVCDRVGESTGDKKFDVLRIVHGFAVEMDDAVGIDCDIGSNSRLWG